MGNCIRKQSSMQWGGEDWGSFGSNDKIRNQNGESTDYYYTEEKSLLRENNEVLSNSFEAAGTEVKVKITKKQLEELLKKTDIQGLSVNQVLAELMNVSHQFEAHQISWSPALQSIPE